MNNNSSGLFAALMFSSSILLSMAVRQRAARLSTAVFDPNQVRKLKQTTPKMQQSQQQKSQLDDPCANCDAPVNNMLGSVKAYDRHVIIQVPFGSESTWERDVDTQNNLFPLELIRLITDYKIAVDEVGGIDAAPLTQSAELIKTKKLKLKLTAMVETEEETHSRLKLISSAEPGAIPAQVVVYPDNIQFTVFPGQFSRFAQLVHSQQPLQIQAQSQSQAPEEEGQEEGHEALEVQVPLHVQLMEFAARAPCWDKLVLVCVHQTRDKRCGRAGPQVIAHLNSLLLLQQQQEKEKEKEKDPLSSSSSASASMRIAVRGSSHIGGHVYAGTLIVYPEGQWYGRITAHNAAELLQHLQAGEVFHTCSRGATVSSVLQW
jgi:hypothetical protein